MKNVIIISGPAGSGKDAVLEKLSRILPFERVITSTTRPVRPNESEGRPYHFLSRSEFEKKIAEGKFIEYSTNENNELYGVTEDEIRRVSSLSGLTLWKLDWKGVMAAKRLFPGMKAILITAPLPILEARLRRRDGKTKNNAYFQERMNFTKEWMKHLDLYDFTIENKEGELDETVAQVRLLLENSH